MQNDPTPVEGSFDRVRLHLLHWSPGGTRPSSAWVTELADVDWDPPEDWPAELERVVSSPRNEKYPVTFAYDEGAVLDIVAPTAKGAAHIIADLHVVSSLLQTWAKPRSSSHAGDQHHLSEAVAKDDVLLVLESHFATDAGAIDSVDFDFEPGEEWFVHVRAGSHRYVGTVTQQGRLRTTHVVERNDP